MTATERPSPSEARDWEEISSRPEFQLLRHRLRSFVFPMTGLFLGCLNSEGHLKWCSAGHGPMLFRRGMTGKFEVLEPTGPPIGVLPDLNCDPTLETEFEPGGILIAMSDGIFEARSPDGELFEVERVISIVEEDPNRTPQQIVTAIQHAVYDWQGGEPPHDDQSMVVIQRDRW